jgi:hypothetical protein
VVRQAKAKPLLDDLERWLRAALDRPSRKSDASAVVMYALNLRPALVRYCDDRVIEIDNSAAERALRGVAVGRAITSPPVPTAAVNAPLRPTR